jgi:uncharacterized protein DUF397
MNTLPLPTEAELAGAQWRKAKKSGTNGNGCMELARIGDLVVLRDSKNPEGPVQVYSRHELDCFLDGAKAGEFDDMV